MLLTVLRRIDERRDLGTVIDEPVIETRPR